MIVFCTTLSYFGPRFQVDRVLWDGICLRVSRSVGQLKNSLKNCCLDFPETLRVLMVKNWRGMIFQKDYRFVEKLLKILENRVYLLLPKIKSLDVFFWPNK